MKMPVPNGILSILKDIMVSYNCESATVELSRDSIVKATATIWTPRQPRLTKPL
jgi:hypothetical protein